MVASMETCDCESVDRIGRGAGNVCEVEEAADVVVLVENSE